MAAVTTVTGIGVRAFPMTRPEPLRAATPRKSRTSPATFRRRRIVFAVLALGVVVVTGQAGAALGGASLASPERRPAEASSSSVRSAGSTGAPSTVVRPGDSLWTVASRLAPGSDPRPVVDALAEARHGTVLTPGETIEWDG